MRKISFLLLFLILCLSPGESFGKGGFKKVFKFTKTGTGIASKYERTIDAEKRAIEDALTQALEESRINVYYGFHEVLSQYDKKSHEFVSSYCNLWSNAVTTYKKIGPPEFEALRTGETKCTIKIKGKIYFKGDPDPAFQLRTDHKTKELGFNQPAYYEGDELRVSFWVTRDSYIHLLIIDEEQNVSLLYPNKFTLHKMLKAGEIFEFPDEELKSKGFILKTYLPEGKKSALELLHVIATKEKPIFIPEETQITREGPYEIFSLGRLQDISLRLAKLKRSDWTMLVLPYSILKKKK